MPPVIPSINFVHKNFIEWSREAAFELSTFDVDRSPEFFKEGRDVWIIQAYIALSKLGVWDVCISDEYRKDCINIAHRIDVAREDCRSNFVVSVRADREPMFHADMEILQNQTSVWSANQIYLPHWPQPGLIPKRSGGNQRIETLGFFGKATHLADDMSSDAFRDALQEISCELRIHEDRWWDYSEVDLVLAVRKGHQFYLDFKPASKLTNAWLAGCPALLGNEAGYRELRKSPLDYIEVTSASDVIKAVAYLKKNPKVYKKMVQNGKKRSSSYSFNKVAERWARAVEHRIVPTYCRWCESQRKTTSSSQVKISEKVADVKERVWGWQASQFPSGIKRFSLSLLRITLVFPKMIPIKLKALLRNKKARKQEIFITKT